MANLTEAWTAAEAAKPLEWQLMGMERSSNEDAWTASARGPKGEHVEGRGSSPVGAVTSLAHRLLALRRDPNGGQQGGAGP